MTLQEIKDAIAAGHVVHRLSDAYTVIRDPWGYYLIEYDHGGLPTHIGLTMTDGKTLNFPANQFYVGPSA